MNKNQQNRFDEIRKAIRNCRKCSMVDHSIMFPGKYINNMKYFFVGAAPWNLAGEEEAFRVGAASQNFDKYLVAAGIDRKECFTTNAVMHVPLEVPIQFKKSRQPSDEEISNCSEWLLAQMKMMQPKIITALGSVALQGLKRIKTHSISVNKYVGTAVHWFGDKYIFVLTHPSPMAVSFRGDEKQIEDYIKLRKFTEKIESIDKKQQLL